jgi:YD repeat-containing protein
MPAVGPLPCRLSTGTSHTLTQRVDPAVPATAVSVSLGYDPSGHQTRLVDGNAHATTYTYNSWGLPESTIEPATTANPAAADRTWTVGTVRPGRLALRSRCARLVEGAVRRQGHADHVN